MADFPLEQYRAITADARAALRMIREVVEQHAPPGSVPSEEMVAPPFVKEAEVLVKGILAIAAKRTGEILGAAPSNKMRKADIERRKKLVPKRKPKMT